MAKWHLYAGTLTKEFPVEIERIRTSDDAWGRDWNGGVGTATSGWKSTDLATRTASLESTRFSEGVEHFVFDDQDATIRHAGTTKGPVIPQFVTLHPQLPVVYVVEWTKPAKLRSFVIGPDGALVSQSVIGSLGDYAVAASVHPSGKAIYVAHWGDGTLTRCHLGEDGAILDAEEIVKGDWREGSPNFSRHHYVHVTPTGNALVVTDVGRDELRAYAADGDGQVNPTPISRIPFPARVVPRHVVFHPSGTFVFVSTERDSTVHVLKAEDGIPTEALSSYSTVPAGYGGDNRPAELDLFPDGTSLYVANRGFDAITAFAVNDSGRLEVLAYEPSLGRRPSAVHVDPSAQYLVVSNQASGNIVTFEIDQDRRLHPLGSPVDAPGTRSLAFAKVG